VLAAPDFVGPEFIDPDLGYPDGTVVIVPYIDDLLLTTPASTGDSATYYLQIDIDGLPLFSLSAELFDDGSMVVDGDLPSDAFSIYYDSIADTWNASVEEWYAAIPVGSVGANPGDPSRRRYRITINASDSPTMMPPTPTIGGPVTGSPVFRDR